MLPGPVRLLLFGSRTADAYELEAVGRFLEYFHAQVAEFHHSAYGRYLAGGEQDIAGQSLIFVVFGDVDVIFLVYVLYLHAP